MDRKLNKKRRKLIGDLLHSERKLSKISQEKMAQILGIRQDQISKMECGERRIDVVDLIVYCKALGFSPTQIAAKIESFLFYEGVLDIYPDKKYLTGLKTFKEIQIKVSWYEKKFSASMEVDVFGTKLFSAESFKKLQEMVKEHFEFLSKQIISNDYIILQWLRYGQYDVKYKFMDARSLLNAYRDYLSLKTISNVSGINQTLLSLYANGKKKARHHQLSRIVNAINKIGKELDLVVCKA